MARPAAAARRGAVSELPWRPWLPSARVAFARLFQRRYRFSYARAARSVRSAAMKNSRCAGALPKSKPNDLGARGVPRSSVLRIPPKGQLVDSQEL
jgi:hypothetical protein